MSNAGIEKLDVSAMALSSVKGKTISLEAWTVPEGSRRLRLPDFKTVCT
jgi:hypothetical protein